MIVAVIIALIVLAVVCLGVYAVATKYEQNPNSIEDRVQDLIQDKYSDKMNRWSARRETTAALARGETVRAVSTEAGGVADMYASKTRAEENKATYESTPERMRRQAEADEATHDVLLETKATELLAQKVQQQMLVAANNLGVPYTVFEAMMQKQKLDELELQKLAAEKRIVLEVSFLYQLRGFHQLFMLRNRMDELIEEIDQIRDSDKSDYVKTRQIAERELDILTLRDKRDAERKRLVQASHGDNLGRGNEDSYVADD